MTERITRSSQELEARENYREAFLRILATRGVAENMLDTVEKANCSFVFKAECDEEDGSIDLPYDLETAFYAPYQGIELPEGDLKPVYVTSVNLCLSAGRIDVQPKLIRYTSWPQIEGFVNLQSSSPIPEAFLKEFVAGDLDPTIGQPTKNLDVPYESENTSQAVSSTIILDFEKGKYYLEVIEIDGKGKIITKEGQEDMGILKEYDLTPNLLNSLTSFLPVLDERLMSEISICKNSELR